MAGLWAEGDLLTAGRYDSPEGSAADSALRIQRGFRPERTQRGIRHAIIT